MEERNSARILDSTGHSCTVSANCSEHRTTAEGLGGAWDSIMTATAHSSWMPSAVGCNMEHSSAVRLRGSGAWDVWRNSAQGGCADETVRWELSCEC
jgi:hypothetical protein